VACGFSSWIQVKDFTREEWKELENFEIWADFGYDALDWEFCVNDVEVGFYEVEVDTSDGPQSMLEL
jgi:hypothetical protein